MMHAAHRWDQIFVLCVKVHTLGQSQITLTVGRVERGREVVRGRGSEVGAGVVVVMAVGAAVVEGVRAVLEPFSGTTTCQR